MNANKKNGLSQSPEGGRLLDTKSCLVWLESMTTVRGVSLGILGETEIFQILIQRKNFKELQYIIFNTSSLKV